MRHTILLMLTALIVASASHAAPPGDNLEMEGRLGYSLGAAAPMGIPATIRKLNSFELTPNILVGIDVRLPLRSCWGIQSGLHLENKGMNVAITTKGYHMAMVKGGEELEGVYTGRVEQQTKAWMLTLPLMASYDLASQWRLRAGPYASFLLSREFSGNVADGYLRKDTPTGTKVVMGSEEGQRATYDFSDDMRTCQMGVTVGIDWAFYRRWGLSADLSWGLTGIHHSDFKTVEQTLYPIYGTIGVFYRIK